ncbi:MAG: TcpQ domain-containing protein [Ottowia sp.]|nr:TcpQ domain-containing protein [Ottowia sp.]
MVSALLLSACAVPKAREVETGFQPLNRDVRVQPRLNFKYVADGRVGTKFVKAFDDGVKTILQFESPPGDVLVMQDEQFIPTQAGGNFVFLPGLYTHFSVTWGRKARVVDVRSTGPRALEANGVTYGALNTSPNIPVTEKSAHPLPGVEAPSIPAVLTSMPKVQDERDIESGGEKQIVLRLYDLFASDETILHEQGKQQIGKIAAQLIAKNTSYVMLAITGGRGTLNQPRHMAMAQALRDAGLKVAIGVDALTPSVSQIKHKTKVVPSIRMTWRAEDRAERLPSASHTPLLPPTQSSVAIAAPKNWPLKSQGLLSQGMATWAEKAGLAFYWTHDRDYPVQADRSYDGPLSDVLAILFKEIQAENVPITYHLDGKQLKVVTLEK